MIEYDSKRIRGSVEILLDFFNDIRSDKRNKINLIVM